MTAFFLRPIPLQPEWFTYTEMFWTAPPGNMADPQPKIAAIAATPNAEWFGRIDIDLQADYLIDTAALLYHNGPLNMTWRVWGRPQAAGPFGVGVIGEDPIYALTDLVTARAEQTASVLRFHSVAAVAEARPIRHIRFWVYQPTGGPPFSCGVCALGWRLQPPPSFGLDWGGGRRIVDLSTVRVLDGGERGFWRKGRVPEVRGSFSHLTDAELRRWWNTLGQVGESDPILLVEDPVVAPGQQEGIHYGTLTGLDFWERRQADKSRIDFRLMHWL